jgi:DNA-binding transcriptional LysR family regulator
MLDRAGQKKKQTIPVKMAGKIDRSTAPSPALRLRLSLRQLEVFVATARGGSTRAAAEQVSRSQSAASAALAELEGVLGRPLFDRVGRRLVLNENGRALLPRANALLDQALQAERLFGSGHDAPLRVAASLSIGEYLLPEVLARWKLAHPHSPVELMIGNTREVLAAVAAFDVDLGFIEGAQTHPQLVARPWRSDELVIVAAPRHPLAGRTASLRQLREATWALREPGSGTREAADRWLIERVGPLRVEFEFGSAEAIKRLVAAGAALGCLAREVVAHELAQGTLVEVATTLPRATRRLAIVLHRDKHLGPGSEDFLQHCRESAPAPP